MSSTSHITRCHFPGFATFTIKNETNHITAHATAQDAAHIPGAEHFRSETELAKLAAAWPAARLVAIWNSLPGVTPLKRFQNRKTGVARIWKALQKPAGSGHRQAASEREANASAAAPEPEALKSFPEATEDRHIALPGANRTAPAGRRTNPPRRANSADSSPAGSKTAIVLELLKRGGGVTINEIRTPTGWQAHSVRGFLSGFVTKKMGLRIDSTKAANQERVYSIRA